MRLFKLAIAAHEKNRDFFDRKRSVVEFEPGDEVMLLKNYRTPGETPKLAFKWVGPYKVLEKKDKGGYTIFLEGLHGGRQCKREDVTVSRLMKYNRRPMDFGKPRPRKSTKQGLPEVGPPEVMGPSVDLQKDESPVREGETGHSRSDETIAAIKTPTETAKSISGSPVVLDPTDLSDFVPLQDPVIDISRFERPEPGYMPLISTKRNRNPVRDREVERMYEKKSGAKSKTKLCELLDQETAFQTSPKPPERKVYNTRSKKAKSRRD